jgi:hypothetical protein
MNPDASTFEEWVKWAFDHPVAAEDEKGWWRQVPDRPVAGPAATAGAYIRYQAVRESSRVSVDL